MTKKEQVPQSNDERIDQDFPGYPHHPAKESKIDQRTGKDRKTTDTERHNGSAHAFEGTENPIDYDDFLSDEEK